MTMQNTILHIKNHLLLTFEAVDTWFEQQEPLRIFRPAHGGWTINEVLEHIFLTNFFLLKLIDKGGKKALDMAQKTDWKREIATYSIEQPQLDQIGMHQSFDWTRPEHMEPKGTHSPEQVRQLLHQQRDICLNWLEQLAEGQGVLHKTTMSVNHLGKIDVYQYIYFLSLHAQRHITQMEKNLAAFHTDSEAV